MPIRIEDFLGKLSPRVWSIWTPPERIDTWDWVCRYARDKDGRRFDPDSFPWMRGVCQAFDSPRYRQIYLMWATRIGKTFGGHAIHESVWATNPMPTGFCGPAEHAVKATVADEIYPMLEHCAPLRGQLLPAMRRSLARIKLERCSCRVAWAGSDSRLSGFGCFYLHATEIDKYPLGQSSEGDRLGLLLERVAKQFPDYKALLESSPATAEVSRIWPLVKGSTNSRYQVPCPWCKTSQVLRLGTNDPGAGGLVWDRCADGSDDVQLAFSTARYVCANCHRELHDEHRGRLMRAGQWVAEGQYVDDRGRVRGEPVRPEPAWGSQLSSLYSLSVRWGDIARRKVECDPRAPDRQIFVNGWLGEVYEESVARLEPEELASRIGVPIPRGIVPAWASFLTAGVDRQEWGFRLLISAWGAPERGHLVDYDSADTWEDVLAFLNRRFRWQCAGPNGEIVYDYELGIALTLIDRAFRPKDTDRFCKTHSTQARKILPCEGDKGGLAGEAFRKKILGVRARNASRRVRSSAIAARGIICVEVAGHYWESVLQDYFETRLPGEPGSFSLCEGVEDDPQLCKELLNGRKSEQLSRRRRGEPIWEKRWDEYPNDLRDTLRYARCAAEIFARGNWNRQAAALKFPINATVKAAPSPGAAEKKVEQPVATSRYARRDSSASPFRRRTT
jgi:phage terminase large subunit GpA-like protein